MSATNFVSLIIYLLFDFDTFFRPPQEFTQNDHEMQTLHTLLRENIVEERKKVNFPTSAGWTPNKQFCFSRSAPFRILSPHSKLWYHNSSQVVK